MVNMKYKKCNKIKLRQGIVLSDSYPVTKNQTKSFTWQAYNNESTLDERLPLVAVPDRGPEAERPRRRKGDPRRRHPTARVRSWRRLQECFLSTLIPLFVVHVGQRSSRPQKQQSSRVELKVVSDWYVGTRPCRKTVSSRFFVLLTLWVLLKTWCNWCSFSFNQNGTDSRQEFLRVVQDLRHLPNQSFN